MGSPLTLCQWEHDWPASRDFDLAIQPFVCETDKAWNAIHRCLTDGTLLYVSGEYPLNHCICGGRQLLRGPDYTISYVSAFQVKDVDAAMQAVDSDWMRRRYNQLDASAYDEVEIGEDDFEYTWENFRELTCFYRVAAENDCAVLFTVS